MNSSSGHKGDVSRLHVMQDSGDLNVEATFKEEEGLILPMVNMPARAYTWLHDVFEDGL